LYAAALPRPHPRPTGVPSTPLSRSQGEGELAAAGDAAQAKPGKAQPAAAANGASPAKDAKRQKSSPAATLPSRTVRPRTRTAPPDRKSTRLNSHVKSSYAVFRLKKK